MEISHKITKLGAGTQIYTPGTVVFPGGEKGGGFSAGPRWDRRGNSLCLLPFVF